MYELLVTSRDGRKAWYTFRDADFDATVKYRLNALAQTYKGSRRITIWKDDSFFRELDIANAPGRRDQVFAITYPSTREEIISGLVVPDTGEDVVDPLTRVATEPIPAEHRGYIKASLDEELRRNGLDPDEVLP